MIIVALSGRKINMAMAGKVVTSLGGVGITGFGLRLAGQQASKFLNVIFPGAGSAVSGTIVAAVTKTIGSLAEQYYIEGIKIKDIT